MEIIKIRRSHPNETHFHTKGFTLGLILKRGVLISRFIIFTWCILNFFFVFFPDSFLAWYPLINFEVLK